MKSKPAQHRLTDRDGDVLNMYHLDDGLYCTVQKAGGAGTSTAGPFTPEQLRAALDEVAPAGSYTRTAEPDDLDGGVTAALIEKEAEQRSCPDLDAHWRLDEALETIERLTRERDKADTANAGLQAEVDRWKARAEQPRPLTPDAITDEMIQRGAQAATRAGVRYLRPPEVREVLTAALTEPPARPEGAEEIEAYMRELVASHPEDHYGELADHLASRGVLPPLTDKTHPEEQT